MSRRIVTPLKMTNQQRNLLSAIGAGSMQLGFDLLIDKIVMQNQQAMQKINLLRQKERELMEEIVNNIDISLGPKDSTPV